MVSAYSPPPPSSHLLPTIKQPIRSTKQQLTLLSPVVASPPPSLLIDFYELLRYDKFLFLKDLSIVVPNVEEVKCFLSRSINTSRYQGILQLHAPISEEVVDGLALYYLGNKYTDN